MDRLIAVNQDGVLCIECARCHGFDCCCDFRYEYNESTKLYDILIDGVKVSSTGTIEAAKLSLDFYENVYYNPLYNDQFGLRRG